MKNYQFFEKRKIPFRKTLPLFGSFADVTIRRSTFHKILLSLYSEFKNHR